MPIRHLIYQNQTKIPVHSHKEQATALMALDSVPYTGLKCRNTLNTVSQEKDMDLQEQVQKRDIEMIRGLKHLSKKKS